MSSADDEQMSLLARGIIDNPCPVVMTDRQGFIVYVNRRFTQLTGYDLESLRGKTPRVFKSSRTPPAVYDDMWRTILAGEVWHGELCNRRRSGEEFWELISISGIRDAHGAITHFLGVWQDVTARKENDETIQQEKAHFEKQSRTDDLTGLYNRRHIFVELDREFERAIRYERPLSGMMIDIDDFKKINDAHGHLAGDRVLRTFSKILQSSIRTIDILGRYGGDEFLLILPETLIDEARVVAERIRKNLTEYQQSVMGEFGILTVSTGLVAFDDTCRADKAIFLGKMDSILLAAKRAGKNKIVIG